MTDVRKPNRGFFIGVLVLFIFTVAVASMRWDLFRDGLWSFFAALFLFATQPGRALGAFNLQLLDFWVASVSLVAVVGLSLKFLLRKPSEGSGSPGSIALRALFNRRIVASSSVLIVAFSLCALWSPLLAPLDPNAQHDLQMTRFQRPMTTVGYVRLEKKHIPSAHGLLEQWIALNHRLLRRDESIVYVTKLEVGDSTAILFQRDERKIVPAANLSKRAVEERTFVLGTDKYGRDILSRLIYGARVSLSIGFMAMILAVALGSIVGVVAGYSGGWTDRILMRTVDLFLAFPGIFLVLLIVALFGSSIVWLILILGLTGWMGVARLVRGQILSLKEQEFIVAARALGFSKVRIIFKHLLPNALAPVIVAASLRIGNIILLEAGLSFLGLGVQPPTPSWGNMINEGRDTLLFAWWISTMPGFAIVAVVTCFNLIGDGLRDVLDPRIRI